MKFYLVKRNDDIDWDEDRAAIIVAKDLSEARLIAKSELAGDWSNFDIKANDYTKSQVILRDNKGG